MIAEPTKRRGRRDAPLDSTYLASEQPPSKVIQTTAVRGGGPAYKVARFRHRRRRDSNSSNGESHGDFGPADCKDFAGFITQTRSCEDLVEDCTGATYSAIIQQQCPVTCRLCANQTASNVTTTNSTGRKTTTAHSANGRFSPPPSSHLTDGAITMKVVFKGGFTVADATKAATTFIAAPMTPVALQLADGIIYTSTFELVNLETEAIPFTCEKFTADYVAATRSFSQ